MVKVGKHVRTFEKEKFEIFQFFQAKINFKGIREAYEDHFLKKFQPSFNVRTKFYVMLPNAFLQNLRHILYCLDSIK